MRGESNQNVAATTRQAVVRFIVSIANRFFFLVVSCGAAQDLAWQDRSKEDRMEEGSDVEPSKVQARSFRKEIEQGVFENTRSMKRQHVGHVREFDRTEKSVLETIETSPKKTTQNTRDGLENHLLGCHFAVKIHLKSLPERSGAPLERPGVSWSAPRTVLGCS